MSPENGTSPNDVLRVRPKNLMMIMAAMLNYDDNYGNFDDNYDKND